jgi:hypothetical protein
MKTAPPSPVPSSKVPSGAKSARGHGDRRVETAVMAEPGGEGPSCAIAAGGYRSATNPKAVLASVATFEMRYGIPAVWIPDEGEAARWVARCARIPASWILSGNFLSDNAERVWPGAPESRLPGSPATREHGHPRHPENPKLRQFFA